ADTVPAVFTKIHVHFIVSGKGLTDKAVARAVNLSAEKYCSASIMLSKAVEITHDYEIIDVEAP
ncbi:MAG TPA: peroxiredoxin, partial [Methylococcaceae bacterium]|nr:peroxiredoxin [Methylococcaceae bacterium]